MKKLSLIIASLFFLFFISENVSAQSSKIKWMEGEWIGVGYQEYAMNQTAWPIELSYDLSKKEVSIHYPSFPCGGVWEFQKGDKNKATFIERLRNGKDRCQDGGTVIVTKINEQYITISYFNSDLTKGVVAFSTLRKKK